MGVWVAPEGKFTIEEFKRLPLEGRRWELLDGKVVQMEMHGANISVFTGRLMLAVDRHVEDHDLGIILGPGCGFRLWPGRETVRVTDISFMRHERVPDGREFDDYPRIAPDLTIEVYSPFERPATVINRIAMFLEAGTRQVWLVDPGRKTVMIFHPDIGPTMLSADNTLSGGEVLPGFSLPVAEIFV